MPVSDSPVLDADFDWFSVEAIRDPQKYDGYIRDAGPVVYSPQYDVWATVEGGGHSDGPDLGFSCSSSEFLLHFTSPERSESLHSFLLICKISLPGR